MPNSLNTVCLTLTLLSLVVSTPVWTKPQDQYPANITELTIHSHGNRMPGLIYQAAGSGPHPTVIFLHGYPGNERSLDVAQAARSNGWNSVYFNYRGAWGAEGEFSFRNAEADVQAALAYLMDPSNAANLRVDPARIALVGHSMGGHMALAGLLDNPAVTCAVSYDGANLGANGRGFFSTPKQEKLWSDYSDTLFMLRGWSGAKAIAEVKAHGHQLDLENRLSSLSERPILMLVADTEVIPKDLHITPLVNAINKINAELLEYHLLPDDHSFSSHRKEVIDLTLAFLNRECRN